MRRFIWITTLAALTFAPLAEVSAQTGGRTGGGARGGTGAASGGAGRSSPGSAASGGRSGGAGAATGANTATGGRQGTGAANPATGGRGRAMNPATSGTQNARTSAVGQQDGVTDAGSPGAGARRLPPRRGARNASPGIITRGRQNAIEAARRAAIEAAQTPAGTDQTVMTDPNSQTITNSNVPSLRGAPSTAAATGTANRGATTPGAANESTANRNLDAPSAADTVNPRVNAPSNNFINRGATSAGAANVDTATNRGSGTSAGRGRDSRFTDRDLDSRFTEERRDSRFAEDRRDSRFGENRFEESFTAPRIDTGFDDTQTDARFTESPTSDTVINGVTRGMVADQFGTGNVDDEAFDEGPLETRGLRATDRRTGDTSADRRFDNRNITDNRLTDGQLIDGEISDGRATDNRFTDGVVDNRLTDDVGSRDTRADRSARGIARDRHTNMATGFRARPQLGVTFDSSVDGAATIARILPNTPAERAGLLPGDEIVAINGRRFSDFQDAFDFIDFFRGVRMNLLIDRDGRLLRLAADLSAPRRTGGGGDRPSLGVWFTAANELTIDHTAPGSIAYNAGLRRGDRILTIDGQRASSQRELTRYLADVQPNERVSIDVFRNGRRVELNTMINPSTGVDQNDTGAAARTAERDTRFRDEELRTQPAPRSGTRR